MYCEVEPSSTPDLPSSSPRGYSEFEFKSSPERPGPADASTSATVPPYTQRLRSSSPDDEIVPDSEEDANNLFVDNEAVEEYADGKSD